jgi:hypothetical protein
MTNSIKVEDINLWLGELFLENKMLQKELARLNAELEETKRGLLDSNPLEERKEKEQTMNNV